MRVVSVFGPFNARALVEMSVEEAEGLLPGSVEDARPSRVVDATEREIAELGKRSSEVAESALAASAVAMAYEIDDPFNSATSKSMCQNRLAEALRELRALAPPKEANDGIDQLAARRAERISARSATAADMPRS